MDSDTDADEDSGAYEKKSISKRDTQKFDSNESDGENSLNAVSEMSDDDDDTGDLGLPFPKNHSPLPRFGNIARFFTRLALIRGEGSKLQRQRCILGFIQSWRQHVGDDIYPVVRLWFPHEDEQLSQSSKLKEAQIGRSIVDALGLAPKSADAIALMGSQKKVSRGGDDEDSLAYKGRMAVSLRFANSDFSYMGIQEVTDKLIAYIQAKKEDRGPIMAQLIETMNPDEFYWFLRILTRNLALNCSERSFLTLFHANAVQVYMVNKNLKTVCSQLWSPDFTVSEANKAVHLMSYYCPMRAKFIKGSTEHMDQIVNLMAPKDSLRRDGQSDFIIEEKIDGERVQLHWKRDGNVAKYYSRKGTDYTSSYGQVFSAEQAEGEIFPSGITGGLSLADLIDDAVEECILDGEIVAWDPANNDICGQSKVRELAVLNKGSTYRHRIYVFDIVFRNGEPLTDYSLRERRKILDAMFPSHKSGSIEGRIVILPYKLGKTVKDIKDEFDRVIGQMSEGLVVKNPTSHYEVDGKSNSWLKVKPEFVDGYQGENLDLLVVGAYKGHGKHSSRMSSYMLALKDEQQPGRFVAFTKVGSGICVGMYDFINSQLEPQMFAQPQPPEWLELNGERMPDFYIKPTDSVVFEVKYTEISSVQAIKQHFSGGYGTGYSLRFPRYVRLRDDKDIHSAFSVKEMLDLLSSKSDAASKRLAAKNKAREFNGRTSLAKRIRMRVDDVATDTLKSEILRGTRFFVCGDVLNPHYVSKQDFEKLIRENGGTVSLLADTNSLYIGDRTTPRVIQSIAMGHAILLPKYLLDCLENGKLLVPEPIHYFRRPHLETSKPDTVDRYGFSLVRKHSIADIRLILTKMGSQPNVSTTRDEALAYIHADPPGNPLRATRFVGLTLYIDPTEIDRELLRRMVTYGGGQLIDIPEAADVVVSSQAIKSEFYVQTVLPEWIFNRWDNIKR